MTTLPLRFRRHLAGSLLRSIAGRRFSTVNYACNDDNDDDVRFIHPSSVVHPNAILGQEQHKDLSRVSAVISLVQSIRESLREDRRGICKFRSWSFS